MPADHRDCDLRFLSNGEIWCDTHGMVVAEFDAFDYARVQVDWPTSGEFTPEPVGPFGWDG